MNPAIEVYGLVKRYKDGVEALRGVSFSVEAGEIVGYLGRNGSGKTTTVRILTTLTSPTGGPATVGGHGIQSDLDGVRRSVGVTMQDAALDNLMTGSEHLELVGGLWGLSGREAKKEGLSDPEPRTKQQNTEGSETEGRIFT